MRLVIFLSLLSIASVFAQDKWEVECQILVDRQVIMSDKIYCDESTSYDQYVNVSLVPETATSLDVEIKDTAEGSANIYFMPNLTKDQNGKNEYRFCENLEIFIVDHALRNKVKSLGLDTSAINYSLATDHFLSAKAEIEISFPYSGIASSRHSSGISRLELKCLPRVKVE